MRSRKAKQSEQLTRDLRQLISKQFKIDAAMDLVRQGADPNVKSVQGNSLLSEICFHKPGKKGNELIEELVRQYSADIEIKDAAGLTPLHNILNEQQVYVQQAMFLIRLGANPDTRDSHGQTLLERLVLQTQIQSAEKHLMIEELVNIYHANIHVEDSKGRTILHRLMDIFVNIEIIMRLIRLGADPDTANTKGLTVLHYVCSPLVNINGKYNHIIEELVKVHHANINLPYPDGDTVLKYNLDQHWLNAAAAMNLVRLGANSEVKDRNGNTLLDILTMQEENAVYKNYKEELLSHRRSEFLSFLFMLTNDIHNKKSNSLFRKLPRDVILYILACYPFEYLHKTHNEGMTLAIAILSEHKHIKKISSMPGGINIFQQHIGHHPVFKFYKSARSLCTDYDNLKEKLTREGKSDNKKQVATLKKFRDKYALSCWNEHSGLFSQHKSRSELFHQIKFRELYHDKELLERMKNK